MTKAVGDWSPINYGEGRVLELDFTDILAEGDSVDHLVDWKAFISVGTDPTPANRILTPPTTTGNKTQQMFLALPDGGLKNIYRVQANVVTTNGEPITGWAYIGTVPVGSCNDGC